MKNLQGRVVWMAWVVALAVSVTSGVAATLEVKRLPAAVSVQAPVPAVEAEALPAAEADASEAGAVNFSPADANAQAACSPPSECFRDRDCDKTCGKGNGVCVRINSCYRACYCAS